MDAYSSYPTSMSVIQLFHSWLPYKAMFNLLPGINGWAVMKRRINTGLPASFDFVVVCGWREFPIRPH